MAKNLMIAFFLIVAYMYGVFTVSSLAFAQGSRDGLTYDSPTTSTAGQTNTFDWRWLLPLLAIPALLLFIKEDQNERRDEYHQHGLIGMKGGETRQIRSEDGTVETIDTDTKEEVL